MSRPSPSAFLLVLLLLCLTTFAQGQGCKATISADGNLKFCSGQSVGLRVDQKGYTYTWYKDGNAISGQKGDAITVRETGSYTVRIDNHATCKPENTLSAPTKITVADYPVADFSVPAGDQCAGSAISFTNSSSGDKQTYLWDFGDPGSGGANNSTEASPKHVYKGFIGQSKTFTAKLTVTNSAGCERVVEKKITVKEGPDADLVDADASNGNTPFVRCTTNPSDVNYTVNVQNGSSTKDMNQSYAIDWGDGSAKESFDSGFATASHTYTKRGGFKLVFTAVGNSGCTSAATYEVYNGSNPSLAVGSPGNTVGCAPETYTFPISGVENNSPATKYTFQFNDNTPPYIFTQENIPASLTHTFNQGSCGMPGDAFTLTATAENPCGITPITVGSIKIASGPQAGFDAPATAVCTNEVVTLSNTTASGSTFTNTGSCNRTSNFSWSVDVASGWEFASGSTAASENPNIIFTKAGTYEITLTSSNGCSAGTATKIIQVITPPAAAYSITPGEGCADLKVVTTNTSTGDALQYEWSVSPATGFTLASGTLQSVDPVFLFTEMNDYVITLKAMNGCDTSTVSKPLSVRGRPVVTLPEKQGYCSPLTITFDASDPNHTPTYTENKSAISAYIWQVTGKATFVNGTSASSQYPAINFPEEGTYTVTLVAKNACGDSEFATQTITIAPAVANAIAGDQTICAGIAPAKLTGAVNGGGTGISYIWEASTTSATAGFAPVPNATEMELTPQPLSETTWFRRRLDAGGCEGISNTVQITVTPTPAAPSVTGATVCAGTIVALQVENPGGVYEWFTDGTGTTPVHVGPKYETPVLQATTTYYVQTQGVQGCPSERVAVTVTVDPAITGNTIGEAQAICTGEQPQDLTGSAPTGGTGVFTYLWEQSTDNKTYTAAAGVNTSQDYEPGPLQQETWYRRRVHSGACESISDPVQVVVNGLITNNSISGPQTICTGTAPLALSGTIPVGGDGSYTYRWEVSTDGATGIYAPAPGENDKAGYEPGTLTQTSWFRRVVLSNICSTPSEAVEITVNETIGNNLLAGDQTICLGSRSTLEGSLPTGGNGTYTYIWEVSTLSESDGFVPAPGKNDEQSYTTSALNQTSWFRRRVTSAPCAVQYSAAVKVTVNAAISQNTVSGAQTICTGDAPAAFVGSTPVGGSGTYSYLWEMSTEGPDTGFGPATGVNNGESYQAEALTQTSWFRRSVLSDPCTPLASNTLEVTVLPALADNTASGTQAICTGTAPGSLTGSSPTGGDGTYTYIWEASTDGSVYSAAPAKNNQANYQPGTLTQTTWFRRVVTSNGCSDASEPVLVTVNEEITANSISQDQLICVGATPAELFGSDPQGGDGTYTYIWESSTAGADTGFAPAEGTNSGIHYQPGAITQTMWLRRVVTAGPCAQSYSFPVKITVTPPIANNTVSMPQAICEGTAPARLTGSAPSGGNGGYTYIWEASTTGANGGFAPAPGANDQLHYTPGQVPVTTWFRRVIYSEGCTNVSGAVQITVVSPVANNLISSDQLVCVGTAPATLQGTAPVGGDGNYTYRWEMSANNSNFSLAPGISDGADYTPGPLKADTWFRRVVVAGACAESISDAVKVTVNAPVANNTIGSPQRACAGTSPGTLHGSTPTGGNGSYIYLWEASTTSATAGFSPAPGLNNTAQYEPDVLQRTTWFRRKVVSLPCQESISAAVLITVDPQPAAPQAKGDEICPGATADLTASSLAATDRIEWFDQEEGGIPLHSGPGYTTVPLLATTDFYVQTVNQQGCASERTKVTATVLDPAADAGPDLTIISGQNAQLRAKGGDTYIWTPSEGLSDPNIAAPVAKPSETTTYTVTITTAAGCTVSDEVTVTVLPKIKITNALTMNGDGLNETWFIENIEHYPDCHVQVFTRWGAKVFESVGYTAPWDGTYQGQQLPMAAYYYIIKLSKTEDPISGSITLIK